MAAGELRWFVVVVAGLGCEFVFIVVIFLRAGAFMALASDNGEESEMMKNASPEDAEE